MIKHLKPREGVPEELVPLFEITSKKMRCVNEQLWNEACKWRDEEIKYVKKHFNINIEQEKYYGEKYLDILTNS